MVENVLDSDGDALADEDGDDDPPDGVSLLVASPANPAFGQLLFVSESRASEDLVIVSSDIEGGSWIMYAKNF